MTRRSGRSGNPAARAWGPWQALRFQPNPTLDALAEVVPGITEPFGQVLWKNGVLAVLVEVDAAHLDPPCPVLHLSFRREDRKPIRDWRHVQRMKSELCGADVEAVELYPAEDRLLDGSNQYHLWAFPPGLRLPWGINGGRAVADNADAAAMYAEHGVHMPVLPGVQRDWEPGAKDAGLRAKGVFQELGLFPEWQTFAEKLPAER